MRIIKIIIEKDKNHTENISIEKNLKLVKIKPFNYKILGLAICFYNRDEKLKTIENSKVKRIPLSVVEKTKIIKNKNDFNTFYLEYFSIVENYELELIFSKLDLQ